LQCGRRRSSSSSAVPRIGCVHDECRCLMVDGLTWLYACSYSVMLVFNDSCLVFVSVAQTRHATRNAHHDIVASLVLYCLSFRSLDDRAYAQLQLPPLHRIASPSPLRRLRWRSLSDDWRSVQDQWRLLRLLPRNLRLLLREDLDVIIKIHRVKSE